MLKVTKAEYVVGNETTVTYRPVINNYDVDTNQIELKTYQMVNTTKTSYDLESNGYAVRFFFIDGAGNFESVFADSIVGNTVKVMIPQGVLSIIGKVNVEIEIIKNGTIVNATGLQLQVDASLRINPTSFLPNNYVVNWEDIVGAPTSLGGGSMTVIDVKDYGALGDGVTDDSTAIQSAIADMPQSNAILLFPAGVYLHGDGVVGASGTGNSYPEDPANADRPLQSSDVNLGRDIRFSINGKNNIIISGYGATILSHPDNGEVRNNAMFDIEDCTNVLIEGITLNGQKNARQPSLNDYDNGQGWNSRSNITVGGGRNIKIKDVTSLGSMMDGIAIGGMSGVPVQNVTIENCICDNAYRNGITLSTTKDVEVKNCELLNTGQTYGTAPMIGLDIEADWGGTYNDDVVVSDSLFKGNVISGLAFSVGSRGCHVERCTFDGEWQYPTFAFDGARWGYNYVTGCRFINCAIPTTAQAVVYRNNTFTLKPTIASGQTGSIGFFHLQGNDADKEAYVIIEGNIFNVDLANVSETATSVDLGRMWFGTRKNVRFRSNMVMNLYSAGSTTTFVFNASDFVADPAVDIQDNTFVFTEDRLLATIEDYYIAMSYGDSASTNLIKNNRIIGYPLSVSNALNPVSTYAQVTGQNFKKSQMLAFNEVYKINPVETIATSNPNLQVETKITVYWHNQRTEIYHVGGYYGSIRVTSYEDDKPMVADPDNVEVYVSGNSIYVKPTSYYCNMVVECNFAGGNGAVTLTDFKNAITLMPDDSAILSLNQVQHRLMAKSVTALSSIGTVLIDVGQSIFVSGIDKPVWWNGVEWVDSAGVVVT